MTDFVSTWNEESFLTTPVGPLGLIAMRGTEEIAGKVNQWLLKWRKHAEATTIPGDMSFQSNNSKTKAQFEQIAQIMKAFLEKSKLRDGNC